METTTHFPIFILSMVICSSIMAQNKIPRKYLHSVIAVGNRNDAESIQKTSKPMRRTATGFLYAYPRSGPPGGQDNGLQLWLITAKHVIEKARPWKEIMVRFNKLQDRGATDVQDIATSRRETHVVPTPESRRCSYTNFVERPGRERGAVGNLCG